MLLQTRPDLTLIAVVGLIAVILFLVKMAEDIHQGTVSPTEGSRRSFIESIVALFVSLVLLAFTLPTAISAIERDDFVQVPENVTVVEDWEGPSPFDNWDGATGELSLVNSPVLEGDVATEKDEQATDPFAEIRSTSGLPAYPSKGDVFAGHFQSSDVDGASGFRHRFGLSDTDNYYEVYSDLNDGEFSLIKRNAGAGVILDQATGIEYEPDTWYRQRITWDDGTLGGADNDITAELIDTSDGRVVASVSDKDSDHVTADGVGLAYEVSDLLYHDYFYIE